MIIKINYMSGTPTYKQIIDGIKEEIALSNLKPMDELPSVRQLALQLKVNPNTVARSYRELIQEGIIFSRQGMGFYIKPYEKANLDFLNEGLKKLLIESKVKQISIDDISESFQKALKEIFLDKPDNTEI